MDALGLLIKLKDMKCIPWSREKQGYPTVSELRRWLLSKSVIINDAKPGPDDEIETPVRNVIFFPKSKGRVTLWTSEC